MPSELAISKDRRIGKGEDNGARQHGIPSSVNNYKPVRQFMASGRVNY